MTTGIIQFEIRPPRKKRTVNATVATCVT